MRVPSMPMEQAALFSTNTRSLKDLQKLAKMNGFGLCSSLDRTVKMAMICMPRIKNPIALTVQGKPIWSTNRWNKMLFMVSPFR